MRASRGILAVILGALVVGVTAAPALAQSCRQLWVERNSIYKDRGYCFKTERAISYFGNAGCRYDHEEDLPLSRAERERVAYIVRMERELGCR